MSEEMGKKLYQKPRKGQGFPYIFTLHKSIYYSWVVEVLDLPWNTSDPAGLPISASFCHTPAANTHTEFQKDFSYCRNTKQALRNKIQE